MTDLSELMRKAADEVRKMSPEQRRKMYEAQLRSYVRAELGFGSDEDEAAYADAVHAGDYERIGQLEQESEERVKRWEPLADPISVQSRRTNIGEDG